MLFSRGVLVAQSCSCQAASQQAQELEQQRDEEMVQVSSLVRGFHGLRLRPPTQEEAPAPAGTFTSLKPLQNSDPFVEFQTQSPIRSPSPPVISSAGAAQTLCQVFRAPEIFPDPRVVVPPVPATFSVTLPKRLVCLRKWLLWASPCFFEDSRRTLEGLLRLPKKTPKFCFSGCH